LGSEVPTSDDEEEEEVEGEERNNSWTNLKRRRKNFQTRYQPKATRTKTTSSVDNTANTDAKNSRMLVKVVVSSLRDHQPPYSEQDFKQVK